MFKTAPRPSATIAWSANEGSGGGRARDAVGMGDRLRRRAAGGGAVLRAGFRPALGVRGARRLVRAARHGPDEARLRLLRARREELRRRRPARRRRRGAAERRDHARPRGRRRGLRAGARSRLRAARRARGQAARPARRLRPRPVRHARRARDADVGGRRDGRSTGLRPVLGGWRAGGPVRAVRRRWPSGFSPPPVGTDSVRSRGAARAGSASRRSAGSDQVLIGRRGVSMHETGSSARRPLGAALLAIAVVTLVAALGTPAVGAAGGQAAQADGSLPYQDASLPIARRVDDLLGRMTLAEKIGQMMQAERANVDADTSRITNDNLGSILSGGGSVPTPNTPTAWADMVDRYQRAALATRLHIPLIYGIDTVHGDGYMAGATVFPHNIGLGATRDPGLVRDVEHVAAEETRTTGPQWAFAPCICVARDDRWGRTYESFGEDPALVERMETAIDGFQGRPGQLDQPDRVLATAKHFAADGLTTYGTGSNDQTTGNYPIDQGVDQVDHATFDRLALAPYVPAVQQHHVGSVMPSYSDVDWTEDGLGNRINMHGNQDLITGWLKDKVGFDGFVISDYNGIDHIDSGVAGVTFADRVRKGVKAGIDMFMQAQNFQQFEATLAAEVGAGRVSIRRIDDAVRRIL